MNKSAFDQQIALVSDGVSSIKMNHAGLENIIHSDLEKPKIVSLSISAGVMIFLIK